MNPPLSTAADFITLFEAIPEERWCVGVGPLEGPTCAYGHTYAHGNTQAMDTLSTILVRGVGNINDGLDPRYQQPTPKGRILAALRDKLPTS